MLAFLKCFMFQVREGDFVKKISEQSLRIGFGFIVAILLSLFQLYTSFFGIYKMGIVHRGVHLGLVLILYFLIIKPTKSKGIWGQFIDWMMVLVSIPAVGYVVFGYDNILAIIGPSSMTNWDLFSSAAIVILVTLAAWRTSKIFFVMILLSMVYVLFGE